MGINVAALVEDKIQEWTQISPKQANPKEPVILAKPNYFDEIITNSNLGLVLVKALYGYGKTFGFGYGIYHEAKRTGEFDAIYINTREVRTHLEKSEEPYSPKLEPTDIIRLICGGFQKGLVNNSDGIYLVTNLSLVNAVCNNFKNYLDNKDPRDALRQFYRDLVRFSNKRVILIIDEIERLTGELDKPDRQILYNWIELMMNVLRPGVLDEYPGRFTLVFLIQEIYYPDDMKNLVESGAHPVLGRMLMVNADGSVPVRFSEESILNYVERIIKELSNSKLVSISDPNAIITIFKSTPIRKLIEDYLVNMPASIAFEVLNELIKHVVSNNDVTIDVVVDTFKKLLDQLPIYEIYAGKRTVAKGEYLANAAAGLLERYYGNIRSISVVPSKVLRVGFEGAYVTLDNEFRAVIFRLSDVDNAQKYVNEFKRLYGKALKESCAQQTKRQTQVNCEVMLLFTFDVNAGPAYNVLARLNIIDGVRVSFNVKPIKLTYDDLFVLITSFNEGKIGIISGHYKYIKERLKEIVNKLSTT